MLALIGNPKEDVYELLFSFKSAEDKTQFLHLLQAHECTACDQVEIRAPLPSEIKAALPIAKVLPKDVLRRVLRIATTFSSTSSSMIH